MPIENHKLQAFAPEITETLQFYIRQEAQKPQHIICLIVFNGGLYSSRSVFADLARLGNLLKLGIDEENLECDKAMELLAEIRIRQGEIKQKIRDLRSE